MTVDSSSKIVVLGGTSGIGLAVARQAAQLGASVIIASRNPASVERALAELPAGVTGSAVDATSAIDVADFLDGVGRFDHFAYTAADPLVGRPLTDLRIDEAQAFFGLRFFHTLDAVRQVVPHLRAAGSITLTSGTAAFKGGAGWTLGAAVCGAMNSAVRSLAAELAPVRVNAVAPGVLRSPLWSAMGEDERERMYAATGAAVPLNRVAEPEDAAKAYLAFMDQDYVTGTIAVVDGGTLVV
ncbi:SDR family oxidoreductase [Microlunatus sp. Gsoil 973]|jgi:NAD(P)-dependent dehydrogenase (short-subunit alcohol dehydrogenase family)|uniref:SDR family oxidoreductase n=1 Tax=Microlunatus sp. Gsoil 973 TaxID=2672569 RepID=UPI0012B4834C|nr:SDR family oxidoreductase [Microlunatus sp. Gsoil 973]QGN32611.1 SDR family oxidoreductase [Microlunatus sp. Gsoil 973]